MYSSPNTIRVIKPTRMIWAGQVARMGYRIGVYSVGGGRVVTEGRRPHGRPRHRWKNNIKMDVQEVRWGHGLD